MERYVSLLLHWNQRINLIGKETVACVWERHILDSAQLYPLLSPSRTLDLGSGAGLPGIVLAILGMEMHIVEADQRKAVFLQTCIRELGLNATLSVSRIEHLTLPSFAQITARALASLTELLTLSEPFRQKNTLCLFPKGKKYLTEIAEAKRQFDFQDEVIPSITSPEGVVLRISQIRRRQP